MNIINKPAQFLTLQTKQVLKERKRKRIGRGMGGKGKTAGRGTKGLKARNSKSTPFRAFEGGQAPLVKVLPKIGPQSHKDVFEYTRVHLRTIEKLVLEKKLSKEITLTDLIKTSGIGKVKDGIVLLGGGAHNFSIQNLKIQVSKVSKTAKDCIDKLNGSVETIYTSKEKMEYLKNPEKFIIKPQALEIPTKERELEYYLNKKNGGYLAGLLKENVPRENILKELLLIRAQGLTGKKCQQ
jgi:large subunit ribosomal protein L15